VRHERQRKKKFNMAEKKGTGGEVNPVGHNQTDMQQEGGSVRGKKHKKRGGFKKNKPKKKF